MNAQFYADRAGADAMLLSEPSRIEGLGGEFAVLSGRVWLTRRGDLDDHVLEAGQRIVLEPADGVVVEPWQRGRPALVGWRPRAAAPLQRRLAARGLRALETGLLALARSAASMARRAQGCICAGDSIASAGTVQ